MSKSARHRRRRESSRWPGILLGLVLTGLVVGGLWFWWAKRPHNQITDITITTREPDDTALVERAITRYLDETAWFGLLDHWSLSLFDAETLEQEILTLFPRFDEAKVAVFDNQIALELGQRRPNGLWCTTESNGNENCWFFDHTMTLYSRAPRFSEGVYIKYSNIENTAPPLGEQILEDETRRYIAEVMEIIEAHDLGPTRVTFRAEGVIDIAIQDLYGLDLRQAAKLIVRRDQAPKTIDERLILLLATQEFKDEIIAAPERFEYADLRFPGRLVYKMNDD